MSTFSFAAAILDLRHLVTFECLQISCIVFPVFENMVIIFWVVLLSRGWDIRFLISVRHLEFMTSSSTQRSPRWHHWIPRPMLTSFLLQLHFEHCPIISARVDNNKHWQRLRFICHVIINRPHLMNIMTQTRSSLSFHAKTQTPAAVTKRETNTKDRDARRKTKMLPNGVV